MKYKGEISAVENEMAYGIVYDVEGRPKGFNLAAPSGWSDFSIIPNSEVHLIDGEDAAQEDGSVTPVFIIYRRDKALVLITKENDGELEIISGEIMDKDKVKF